MPGLAAPAASFAPYLAAPRFALTAGPTAIVRTQVCGPRCWIAAKMKLRKALKRHGWQLQRRPDARGGDKMPGYLDVTSLTKKITRQNMQLAYDSGNETASTSSDTLDSSIVHEEPMHLTFRSPETHPAVPTEASSLFDGQSNSEPSLSISVIGATGELARSKVFPALFALYYSGFLPQV